MVLVGMLELRRVDNGMIRSNQGEEEGNAGGDTYRCTYRGPDGADLKLSPDELWSVVVPTLANGRSSQRERVGAGGGGGREGWAAVPGRKRGLLVS